MTSLNNLFSSVRSATSSVRSDSRIQNLAKAQGFSIGGDPTASTQSLVNSIMARAMEIYRGGPLPSSSDSTSGDGDDQTTNPDDSNPDQNPDTGYPWGWDPNGNYWSQQTQLMMFGQMMFQILFQMMNLMFYRPSPPTETIQTTQQQQVAQQLDFEAAVAELDAEAGAAQEAQDASESNTVGNTATAGSTGAAGDSASVSADRNGYLSAYHPNVNTNNLL